MAPALENNYCGLLTDEENLQIFKLLGNRCQSLCTTVVQLFLTKPPDHSQWFKKTTGILCFVKDNTKKNFFFRLFCTQRNMKIWEHEMYNNMEYIEATPFFHFFEGENCHVAFNFANVEDARDLRIVVNQKIHARKRREEKRCKQISQSHTLPPPTTHLDIMHYKKTLDPASQQAKRKRNITKADIGIPKDFKHISHVGWDSTHGFDVNTDDPKLKDFFLKAGVSEKQLQDKSTREYIYEFINRNGGLEAIEQTNRSSEAAVICPPAVPPRGPPMPRSSHLRNAPPPPIPNKNVNNNVTPRKPRMDVPPPKKPAPVPNSGAHQARESVPAAPPAPAPPPPPPPPPMMDESAPCPRVESCGTSPPPPPMGPLSPGPTAGGGGGNSALLESIRNGTTLKSVEERKAPPAQQDDARGDLLSEIRKGMKLRPVDEREVKPSTNPPPSRSDDLASALKRALADRKDALYSEDDDDKSDSTDSEWDD